MSKRKKEKRIVFALLRKYKKAFELLNFEK